MDKYEIGDLVVLASGSMRMAVEAVDGEQVACVWCHEGEIGRDTFHTRILKRWEFREDDARPREVAKPAHGPGTKLRRARDDRDERPRKTGWDGKPREKKYFRKDG
jgi:hypothetical protein